MQHFSFISNYSPSQKAGSATHDQNQQSTFFKPFVQPKLTINQPNDVYEQEADAMAGKVMQMDNVNQPPAFFKSPVSPVQRKCAHCEQEANVQKKEAGSAGSPAGAPSLVHDAINSGGQPLDSDTRGFMESRFGYDFGNVQVHNDSLAHQSAAEINALAYTHANHISFGAGQYQPQTDNGKQLLAHELTHVVQQAQHNQPMVSRAVDDSSSCPASVDKTAPPKPLMFIGLHDMSASSMLSFAIVSLKLDLMVGPSGKISGDAFDAYRKRFGDPVAAAGKFKDRFDGTLHPSLEQAQASEMRSIIARLESVGRTLDNGISYQCIGTAARKVGGCSFRKCGSGDVLAACKGMRTIAICPDFWHKRPGEQGASIIHELFHIKFKFGDHDTAPYAQTAVQRLSEPECYSGFVGDINKESSFDPSCPPV